MQGLYPSMRWDLLTLSFHTESFVLGQKTIHHLSRVMTLLMKLNQKMKKTVSSHWQITKNTPVWIKIAAISKILYALWRHADIIQRIKNTGSQLTLLLKCNKGISAFIDCFPFVDVSKGTYATCMIYAKYMKISFEIK